MIRGFDYLNVTSEKAKSLSFRGKTRMTDLVSPEWTLFHQMKMWWTPLLMLMVLLFRNDIFFIGKVLKVWYRVLGESFIKGFLKRQGQKYAMKIIGFLFNDHFCNSNMLLPFFKCYCSRDLLVNYTFHTFKWSPLELQKDIQSGSSSGCLQYKI